MRSEAISGAEPEVEAGTINTRAMPPVIAVGWRSRLYPVFRMGAASGSAICRAISLAISIR